MNKIRRKALGELLSKLEDIQGDIVTARDEEQDYLDNMPESLQGGEKATTAESAVSAMDDAINMVDEAAVSLGEAIQQL